MTKISEMSKKDLDKYIKEQCSNILLADLIDCFQFDIARLSVMYIFPDYFNAVYQELLCRLSKYDRIKVINFEEED